MKNAEISAAMRGVLGQVFINMPWRYLGTYIDLVLENRINIQIGFWADDLDRVSANTVLDAIGSIRRTGSRVTAHGPFMDLCPGSVDPLIRKVTASRLARLLDLLEQIRPEQLVCHTGFDPRHHRTHFRDWVENSLTTWEPLVRTAEKLRMPLLLENVFEEGPELHLELIEKIRSPWFGFCLDVGHQHSFSPITLDRWLEAVWPHLKEVHLHDNDKSLDSHSPIGSGTFDFDYLFDFMREKKISPVLTLEPHTVEHMVESVGRLAQTASFKRFAGARSGRPGTGG